MKTILLLIISLFLVSCGSRQKAKENNVDESYVDGSIKNSSTGEVKTGRKESDFQVSDLSKTSISVIPKCKTAPGVSGAPGVSSPRTMTIKDVKGNITNIPVDENSEIKIENSSELTSKLKFTELQLAASEKENKSLQMKYEKLQEQNRLSVKSDRPVWWLYILIFFVGMIFIPLIKYFIKR